MDESQIAMPTAPQKNPAPKLVNLVIPQLRKGDNWVYPKQCTHGISMKQPNLYPLFLGRFFKGFPPGVREIQLSPENSTPVFLSQISAQATPHTKACSRPRDLKVIPTLHMAIAGKSPNLLKKIHRSLTYL